LPLLLGNEDTSWHFVLAYGAKPKGLMTQLFNQAYHNQLPLLWVAATTTG